MFGKNPIRKQELRTDGQLWVQEVFRTIQGEGPRAGTPAVFIRLAGCNLACQFCDTEFESGQWLDWEQVGLKACGLVPDTWAVPLFVLTGGEPMRQDIRPLVRRLSYLGTVQVETAGTLWLDGFDSRVEVVVSPKSGNVNAQVAARAMAWKYIIRAGQVAEDGLPSVSPQTGTSKLLARPPKGFAHDRIFVQPCDEYDDVKNSANLLAAKESAEKHGYRLSLQLHKQLGVP